MPIGFGPSAEDGDQQDPLPRTENGTRDIQQL